LCLGGLVWGGGGGGLGPNPQPPNPQSPIPNPQYNGTLNMKFIH